MITVALGRIAQFLMALAMLRVATTLLTPEELGKVSLVITTTAFFAMFLINPVGMFINRRLHSWNTNGVAQKYLRLYGVYLLLVAITAFYALMVIINFGALHFGMASEWVLFLVCAGLVFNTINQTSIPSLNLLGQTNWFIVLTFLSTTASFAISVHLVESFEFNALNWVLGQLIGQILFAAIGTWVLFKRLRRTDEIKTSSLVSKRHIKILMNFAWPVAVAAGLGWLQNQGYRYLVESYLGLAQLGLFVAGFSISMGIMSGFESVLTTYFQPVLYKDTSQANAIEIDQAWLRYAAVITPALFSVAAFMVLLAPELTKLFLGPTFQTSAKFLIYGAIVELGRSLSGVIALKAHVRMETHRLMLPNAVGSVIAIALAFVCIPLWGLEGAGFALVCAAFASVFCFLFFMHEFKPCTWIGKTMLHFALLSCLIGWLTYLLRMVFPSASLQGSVSILLVTGGVFLGFQIHHFKNYIFKK